MDQVNVFEMHDEIVGEQKTFNLRHQIKPGTAVTTADLVSAHNRLVTEIGSTVLSFVRDLAQESGEQQIAISELEVEGAGGGTQFTTEDAERFMRVVTYAENVLEASLKQPMEASQRSIIETLLTDAKACKENIEENTLDEDDEDEGEEGEGEEEPEELPEQGGPDAAES